MAKFNFNLRDPKSKQQTQIHLIIRWNNQRLVFPTNERIKPEYWETDKTKSNFQRAKRIKSFPEYPEFNMKLENIITIAKNVFRQYQNENEQQTPTKGQYKELLYIAFNRKDKKVKDLFTFFQLYIDESKKTKRPKTVQWYENTLLKLKNFSHKQKIVLDFDSIDLDFYHNFMDYLTYECKYSTNSIGKHIQNLKAVLNESVERELNTNLKFRSKKFKKIVEETENIYLTKNEIELMYKLDLSQNPKLDKVRDLFIVGCWTGLRYSDFSKIRRENIEGGFISITMIKTGNPTIIPLHPIVIEIMDKYRHNINSLPPSISDDKMRKYLKEIGEMIPQLKKTVLKTRTKEGVKSSEMIEKYKQIGTHTARRSFATNLFNDGMDSITIMNITGHKTERAFLKYIKTSQKQFAERLNRHWVEQSNLKAIN